MSNRDILKDGIVQLGIELESEQLERLLTYLQLLNKWNKVYNLTAIRDPRQMVSNHLLDSLSILPYLWPGRWLDVGCGAGLPGLVMAIARPDWQISLLDSNSKKTSFVQQAAIELGLKNVAVYCARVETWEADSKFDGIVSRAFTDLGQFLSVTRHLMADQGRWAAMKGEPEQELAGVAGDCQIERIIRLQVPGLNAARSLVIATCKGAEEK